MRLLKLRPRKLSLPKNLMNLRNLLKLLRTELRRWKLSLLLLMNFKKNTVSNTVVQTSIRAASKGRVKGSWVGRIPCGK